MKNNKISEVESGVAGNNQKKANDRLVLFADWYSVWPGNVGFDKNGVGVPVDAPHGVRLEVQKGERSKPIMSADRPWESSLAWVCVLPSAAGFKMWYMSSALVRTGKNGGTERGVEFDPMAGEFEGTKKLHFICYAESNDGFAWTKPELGLVPFEGKLNNNIVMPCGSDGFDSVFRDRDGGYLMLFHGDPLPGGSSIWKSMRSARSPDGIHWTPEPEPVMDMYCDTQNVGFYDELACKYVCYVRYARGSRRAVGMTESARFSDLPHPGIVLEPDSQDPPCLDFYTNAYSRHPQYKEALCSTGFDRMGRETAIQNHADARDSHFLFPAIYHRDSDLVDVHLAFSRDGVRWSRPERKPVIQLDPQGYGAGGSIYAAPGIHTLGSEMWGVLYSASDGLHNTAFTELEKKTDRTYRWAMWKLNRLVALRADAEGACTVMFKGIAGKAIKMNYKTDSGGWIRAELVTQKGLWPPTGPDVIKGYSFNECEPLTGDSLSKALKWNGSGALPEISGEEETVLRLRMMKASLFAVSWE